jgi:hypothetical protein
VLTQTVKDAVRRISELQEIYETTGASTVQHIRSILAELSIDDLLIVHRYMKQLGVAHSILSGRSMRHALKADDAASSVVYGKNATAGVSNDAR